MHAWNPTTTTTTRNSRVSVDTSLLVTYKTHTRAPCVYIYTQHSRASRLCPKVSSSAWWYARRPYHFSTRVAQHTTHTHPARWREYSRRTHAPVWQRARTRERHRQRDTTRHVARSSIGSSSGWFQFGQSAGCSAGFLFIMNGLYTLYAFFKCYAFI